MAEVFLGPRPAAGRGARADQAFTRRWFLALLPELAADPRSAAPKGEIVVLVGPGEEGAKASEAGRRPAPSTVEALERMAPGEAAAEVAKALGLSRRALYARALALKGK